MTPGPRHRARWHRPHLPRRTARLRFTVLYGGLFVLSGAMLVAVTFGLFQHATEYTAPPLPQIPHPPAIRDLTLSSPLLQAAPQLGNLRIQIQHLTAVQRTLAHRLVPKVVGPPGSVGPPASMGPLGSKLTKDQHTLTRDQHQLTAAVHHLAQAVHQVTQAGAVEAAQRAADSHRLLVDSGIALVVVSVLALLAGWLVAGRMLRPIRTITRTARRISSTNLHERLALAGPQDELKELGNTLDDLFERLDAAFDAQRHFVANASHELRTPLTAERNLLQVALCDPHTSAAAWRATALELLASNDEQGNLIESLLTLARSESGLDHHQTLDLAVLARTVVLGRSDLDRLGLRLGVAFTAAPVDGDPRLLESLVANLVDNATTYNVEGGRVDVRTGTRDGDALLAVSNTGPVVAPGEVDRLFQPFQRLDPHRVHHAKGHGLGLSIVRAIADAHGAAITAHPAPHGGLAIEITFPPATELAGDAHPTAAALRVAG